MVAVASAWAARLARLGVAEGGFAAALGLEDLRLLLALGLEDFRRPRLPSASRIWARFSRSAFICRPIALTMSAGGRMSLISTRVILTPPGLGRLVDDGEEPRVDLVAPRQGLVEVHRAHHGTQVRGRELHDREIEVGDFIGRLGRVEHLEEDHAVDRDDGIVPW